MSLFPFVWYQKSGKVVGLFNLPNEDAFQACQDFCVEDASLLALEQENVSSLKGQLRSAIEKSVQAAKEARDAKEKLAEESKQRLIEQEEFAREKSKFDADRAAWKKERKTLQKSVDLHLGETKKLKEDLIEAEKQRLLLQKKYEELQRERQSASVEIQEQLRDERESMAILVQERKKLKQTIKDLKAENAQLRQSTVELTTTDLMNRRALLQYLEHINSHNPSLASSDIGGLPGVGSSARPGAASLFNAGMLDSQEEATQNATQDDDDGEWDWIAP